MTISTPHSAFSLDRLTIRNRQAGLALLALGIGTFILGLISGTFLVIGLIVLAYAVMVYADPPRAVPDGSGLTLAPIDGRITQISTGVGLPLTFDQAKDQAEHFTKIEMTQGVRGGRTLRAPITGTVREILRYTPDDDQNVAITKHWAQMDGVAILLSDANGAETALVLNAPFIPRQIYLTVQVGDEVRAGDVIGIALAYASAELYMPNPAALLRTETQHIQAGETILQVASFVGTLMFRTA